MHSVHGVSKGTHNLKPPRLDTGFFKAVSGDLAAKHLEQSSGPRLRDEHPRMRHAHQTDQSLNTAVQTSLWPGPPTRFDPPKIGNHRQKVPKTQPQI